MHDLLIPGFSLFAFTGIVGVVGYISFLQHKRRETRREAAARLGLTYRPAGVFSPATLTGELAGVPVEIRFPERKNASLAQFRVGEGLPLPPLRVRPPTEGTFSRLWAGAPLQTGDAEFDARVHLAGDDPETETALRALLDAPTRAAVADTVTTHRAFFAEGCFQVETSAAGLGADEIEETTRTLVRTVRAVLETADAARDTRKALARNAREDPHAAIRQACFRTLVEQFPGDPITRETAEALSPFREPQTEFLRVLACGDAIALPLLQEMARENLPFDLRGAALNTLVERFGYADNKDIVVEGLGARTTADRVAAARLIAAQKDTTQTPRLGQLMLREPEETGAVGFAQALGALGDPAAEADLLTLLARPSDATQLAAATALGQIGAVTAVEPLLALTEGLFRDGDVREAATEAVRRIQARLGPVEAGRVSLAPDAIGRVSIARGETRSDATAGAVSVAAGARTKP
jgi:hypothetical protein